MDKVITRADGSVASLVGNDAVEIARYATLLAGLRLEQQTNGRMRISRGINCRALAKQETGLRTNDYGRLIARVELMLEEQKRKVVYVGEEDQCQRET